MKCHLAQIFNFNKNSHWLSAWFIFIFKPNFFVCYDLGIWPLLILYFTWLLHGVYYYSLHFCLALYSLWFWWVLPVRYVIVSHLSSVTCGKCIPPFLWPPDSLPITHSYHPSETLLQPVWDKTVTQDRPAPALTVYHLWDDIEIILKGRGHINTLHLYNYNLKSELWGRRKCFRKVVDHS